MDAKGKLIPLSSVPSLIAELTGVWRHRATVYRWAKVGCRSLDARMVKLKTEKKMGQLFTTRKDVVDFIFEVG